MAVTVLLPKPGGTFISAFAGTQGIWTSPNGHQHYVVTRICSPDLSALALNHARGVVGPLEGVLGASWGVLVRLGASWGRLGAVLGRLGAVSGRLWDGFAEGRIKKVDREIFRWCPERNFVGDAHKIRDGNTSHIPGLNSGPQMATPTVGVAMFGLKTPTAMRSVFLTRTGVQT